MPKRVFTATRRIPTPEVQGPDSYIVLRTLRRGDATLEDLLEGAGGSASLSDSMSFNDKVVTACLVEWNWVDDDGEPLPLPSDDPEVLNRLYAPEYQLLVQRVTDGINVQLKN